MIDSFEHIDSHPVHRILLPKADVPITIFEDVYTITLTHTIETLS